VDEDRRSWPLVVGITAGVLSGIIAGVYLYSTRVRTEPEIKLRDAAEIINQCRDKIQEIEAGLETLRQPLVA